MILVAGGQLDPNIGALLRRVLARGLPFRDLLVGPSLAPTLRIDLDGTLELDGQVVEPSACFVRHDVFLALKTGATEDQKAALNWHHAVRGWAGMRPRVRLLNRRARGGDHNKLENLALARDVGLAVPATVIATDPRALPYEGPKIRKPAAGGELTEAIVDAAPLAYPFFVQARLERPELRVYRVGDRVLGFELESPDLDYRQRQKVVLRPMEPPAELAERLVALCEALGLDFAAADFMRTADGEWTFLEVNSQPMFAAFDKAADGRLCDAILDWLHPDG